jgi:hypothetical protein
MSLVKGENAVLRENNEANDDWMLEFVKNKRIRVIANADVELPPLDSLKCVLALVPSDDGYEEVMEN